MAGPNAPKEYVSLSTGETRSSLPEAEALAPPASGAPNPAAPLAAPPGADQPSASNVVFDVYLPSYRSRDPWLIKQMGADAAEELLWWRAAAVAARTGAPAPSEPKYRDATLADAAGTGDAAAAVADETAGALVLAARDALGDARFAATWDSKSRRYIMCHEIFSDSGGTVRGGGGKRGRTEETTTRTGLSRVTTVVRPSSSFPSVRGADVYTNSAFHSNASIAQIYIEGRVTTGSGLVRKINAAVGPRESRHLYCLVRDNRFKRVLEVGMANGLSALAICQALSDNGDGGSLTSIDPFQSTQWDNAARAGLARAGLSSHSTVIEEASYLAMPQLLADVRAGRREPFDLIFVDGMHLFDFTLLDIFYSDLLLRVGGVLCLDDIRHRGVKPVYDYALKNYDEHLKLVPDTGCSDTLGTFIKYAQDARSWDFHNPFFGGGRE